MNIYVYVWYSGSEGDTCDKLWESEQTWTNHRSRGGCLTYWCQPHSFCSQLHSLRKGEYPTKGLDQTMGRCRCNDGDRETSSGTLGGWSPEMLPSWIQPLRGRAAWPEAEDLEGESRTSPGSANAEQKCLHQKVTREKASQAEEGSKGRGWKTDFLEENDSKCAPSWIPNRTQPWGVS